MQFDYPLIDADNHYYEPYDCFTRHIEKKYLDRAVNVRKGADGLGRVYIGDRRLAFYSIIGTDRMGLPGSLRPYFEGTAERHEISAETIDAHEHPPMMNRDARLDLMNEQGIEATVLYPSLAVGVEHELRDDVEATYANARAFNRWLEDDWGYAYQDRIFAAPLMSLLDVDEAVKELDRVLALGARVLHVKPGPVYGKSPADPSLDPFWARVNEAGVPVALHVGNPGYCELYSVQWGEPANPQLHRISPFQSYLGMGERPLTDTLAAMVFHNLFGRFPDLKILSIENGSDWAEWFPKKMDKMFRPNPMYEGLGGRLTAAPSELFHKHVYVSPFFEDDIPTLVAQLGPDRVLFGSDWPHPEAIDPPADFGLKLSGLDATAVRKIMRTNSADLLGLAA